MKPAARSGNVLSKARKRGYEVVVKNVVPMNASMDESYICGTMKSLSDVVGGGLMEAFK
jgi:hypothetical protein